MTRTWRPGHAPSADLRPGAARPTGATVVFAHPFGQVLVSLPGIGPRTGARTLAEIGDGGPFDNGSKLASPRTPT